jgi:excisionase family DNA binding protein
MNTTYRQILTVEEVAERLNLHAKTVRRFIREGRLPAKRIGKSYRVTRQALDEFAGEPTPRAEVTPRTRQVSASTIVDVDAIGPDESQRITTLIMAGLNARKGEGDFPRVDTLYYAEQGRLRVMITGSASLTCDLLQTIDALADKRDGPQGART